MQAGGTSVSSQYLAAYCVENPTDYGCSLARPVFERLYGEEVNVTVHVDKAVKSAFLQAKACGCEDACAQTPRVTAIVESAATRLLSLCDSKRFRRIS